MAAGFVDQVKVAVITATLVSAAWIVAAPIWLDCARLGGVSAESSQAQPVGASQSADLAAPQPGTADRVQAPANRASSPGSLMIPVEGVSAGDLVDSFADGRGADTRSHEAIDIMADRGTGVVAAAAGTVERLFRSEAGGNTAYLRSEDGGTIYYYAHLDAYAPGLTEGQQVRRGQRIGTVGSSGNADPAGPHLHFQVMRTTPDAEWWVPATSVNPYPLLTRSER